MCKLTKGFGLTGIICDGSVCDFTGVCLEKGSHVYLIREFAQVEHDVNDFIHLGKISLKRRLRQKTIHYITYEKKDLFNGIGYSGNCRLQ